MNTLNIITLIISILALIPSIVLIIIKSTQIRNIKKTKYKITLENKAGKKYTIDAKEKNEDPNELISLVDNLTHNY